MNNDMEVAACSLARLAVTGEKYAGVPGAPGAARAAAAAAAPAAAPAPAPAPAGAPPFQLPQNISEALNNPYVLNSLLGAGAGGLLGLATGGRRKWRDALHYGLLGGLGGAGLTAGYNMLSKAPAPPAPPPTSPIGTAAKTTYQVGSPALAAGGATAVTGGALYAADRAGKFLSARVRPGLVRDMSKRYMSLGPKTRWGIPLAAAAATGLYNYFGGGNK